MKPVSVKPVFAETGLGFTVKPVSDWSETGFVCLSKPACAKSYKTIISFEVRIRAYLHYGEPDGGKPSALYQNPATIILFDKTIRLRSN